MTNCNYTQNSEKLSATKYSVTGLINSI